MQLRSLYVDQNSVISDCASLHGHAEHFVPLSLSAAEVPARSVNKTAPKPWWERYKKKKGKKSRGGRRGDRRGPDARISRVQKGKRAAAKDAFRQARGEDYFEHGYSGTDSASCDRDLFESVSSSSITGDEKEFDREAEVQDIKEEIEQAEGEFQELKAANEELDKLEDEFDEKEISEIAAELDKVAKEIKEKEEQKLDFWETGPAKAFLAYQRSLEDSLQTAAENKRRREPLSPIKESDPPWIQNKKRRAAKQQGLFPTQSEQEVPAHEIRSKIAPAGSSSREPSTALDRFRLPVRAKPTPKRQLKAQNKFAARPTGASSSSSGQRPKQEEAKKEIKEEKPRVEFDDDDF